MAEHLQSIIVDLDPKGKTLIYEYMCREGFGPPPLAIFEKPIQLQELKELVKVFTRTFTSVSVSASKADGAEFRDYGGRLFDRLIPLKLAERLTKEPEAAYLVLYLHPALAWIPWELLWDGQHFLCRRFKLARLPRKPGAELGNAERRLEAQPSGRALIVFGDIAGLEACAEREKSEIDQVLTTLYGSQVWFFGASRAVEVLEHLKKDYDICHFVGHGNYAEQNPAETGWKFADGSVLTCQHIEQVASHAVFPRLIFANSCYSARASIADAEEYVSTLYRAFLKRGVPHYIGTTAQIPDEPSSTFAHAFYQGLANGQSVGEALYEARRIFYEVPGMPIWAYYVHYGDPTDRFISSEIGTTARYFPRAAWHDVLEYDEPVLARQPFVDREEELAGARTCLSRLAEGQGSILFVAGEAGVGKYALAQQIISEGLRDVPGLVAALGRCDAQGQLGIVDPYAPFKQIFRSLLRNGTRLSEPRNSAVTVGELAVMELLLSFPHLVPIFRPEASLGPERWKRICRRFGISPETGVAYGSGLDQTSILDQICRLFRSLARSAPLILVVDNLHWADESSIMLFHHLGYNLDAQFLLIGTYRPHEVRTHAGIAHPLSQVLHDLQRHGALRISLDLSTTKPAEEKRIRTFVAAYLENQLPGHRLPAAFTEKLVFHTGGNALFLAELLKYAREKGYVVCRDGIWELTSNVEQFELPESIKGLIDERVADLSKELRETLSIASVEGEDFTAEVLARLQRLDEDQVLGRLVEDLQRIHRLIDEGGEREVGPKTVLSLFHFHNTLIQQRVYGELTPAKKKRSLHKQVGECLEDLYGGNRSEIAGQLAAHFRIAREWKKALGYAVEAARACACIYANSEAIRFYKMALEVWELETEKDTAVKMDVLHELGGLHKFMSNYAEAIPVFEQILTQSSVSKKARGYALIGLGDSYGAAGDDYDKALQYYKECELIAREIEDRMLLSEVWTDFTVQYYRLWLNAIVRKVENRKGTYRAKVIEYGTMARQLTAEVGAWENLRRVYVILGSLALNERAFPEAEKMFLEATTLADEHQLVKKSLNSLGELRRLQERYKEALEYYNAYLNWALKTGATGHELMAYHNIGMLHLACRDYESARDFFNKSLQLNRPVRNKNAALSLAMMGFTFELQGSISAAHGFYRRCLGLFKLPAEDNQLYGSLGRLLYAYEPQPAAYFLNKYLEQSPADSAEIQEMLDTHVPTPFGPRKGFPSQLAGENPIDRLS